MRWLGEKPGGSARRQGHALPGQEGDVLELDELWSFVGSKAQTLWLWVALCRRTRQVVAWTLGDRSLQSACDLRAALPEGYRHCATRSDVWGSLRHGVPERKPPLLRQSRRRDHPVERWFGTLRARQPPDPQSLLLFQVRRKPPGCHSPLHHHLQRRHPTESNKEVITTGQRNGMLGVIFRKAQNKIQDPAKLRRLIVDLIARSNGRACPPT